MIRIIAPIKLGGDHPIRSLRTRSSVHSAHRKRSWKKARARFCRLPQYLQYSLRHCWRLVGNPRSRRHHRENARLPFGRITHIDTITGSQSTSESSSPAASSYEFEVHRITLPLPTRARYCVFPAAWKAADPQPALVIRTAAGNQLLVPYASHRYSMIRFVSGRLVCTPFSCGGPLRLP